MGACVLREVVQEISEFSSMEKILAPPEGEFSYNELFFSVTDPRGVIQFGNSVFSRVAEYEVADLNGKPHNVIRHPNMPKCVFRLLWQTIQSGNPITAYVLNRSKLGKAYWVCATVIPVESGYLSVRTKPASGYFNAIPKLYKTLRNHEANGQSVDATLETLKKTVRDLGYTSYDELSQAILTDEMTKISELSSFEERAQTMSEAARCCTETSRLSRNIFSSIMNVANRIKETIVLVQSAFAIDNQIRMLSFNMTILAEKEDSKAHVLSAVCHQMTSQSDLIHKSINELNLVVSDYRMQVRKVEHHASLVHLQLEMISYFVNVDFAFEELSNIRTSHQVRLLVTSATQLLFDIRQTILRFRDTSLRFERLVEEMNQSIVFLEIVRVRGLVESAELSTSGASFEEQVKQISAQLGPYRMAIKKIEENLAPIQKLLQVVEASLETLEHGLLQFMPIPEI